MVAGAAIEATMFAINDFQKLGKDQMDAMNRATAAYSRNMQQIATETADFSKKSMEQGAAALEKLMAVKTLDKAIEVQSDYAKQAYEAYVAQATKMGELLTGMTKDAMKPFEGAFAQAK